jgi:aspartyl-tRNA(Asn)/glutamyl-tRNA(Gln) amidotransferase subunit A
MSQWLPIAEIAGKVKSGELKAVDLVNQAYRTIGENKDYNAIISLTRDRALERATQIDQAENKGRLAGVPFIAKDNFLAFGAETTAGSNILKGFNAPYQASVIEKLEAEGAICVAKANLDAFAHGSSTENSDFGVTKNPHDKSRVAGGSSGGSAAAVALDFVPFALGSDTGGSIRLPASFCGCVGYKPTYGLVSRSGVVAMASSLDVIGPLTRTIDDTAIILDVMSGRDDLDSTTIERDKQSYTDLDISLKGQKIGIIKEYLDEGVDEGVKSRIEEAVDKLKAAGAEVSEISLPSLPLALAVYYIICPAEVSSNLSRYDGIRYGHSDKAAKTVDEQYLKARGQGFGAENKRRIMIGTHVLSSGYYDAYYKTAQTVRTKLINEFAEAFNSVDFLLGPISPTTAFEINSHQGDPMKDYLVDIMTVAANLVGIPAISLPIGSVNDLPVGLQLMGRQRADRQLLALAKQTEELIK